MRPLRRQMLVGWLALIAMTLQLALSFGHFHSHDHSVAVSSKSVASTGLDGGSQAPADDDDDEESHCGICWAMALSRLAIVALSPSIAPPQLQEFARRANPDLVLVTQGCPASFQARGPPTVIVG